MEINIQVGKKAPSFLTKLTAILFGVFATSLTFAIFTKSLGVAGIWLALAFCAILIFIGFYYIKKGTLLRLITWSILITIILVALAFFISIEIFQSKYSNLFG